MAGLQAEKRARVSRELAEECFRLAVERGLDGFVIEDVTTATGYSRRTFANHFSCKEAAIAEIVVMAASQSLADVQFDTAEGSLLDSLEDAVQVQFDKQTSQKLAQAVQLAHRYPSLQPYILAAIRALMTLILDAVSEARGGASADLDTVLLLNACYGMIGGLISGDALPLSTDPTLDPADIEAQVHEFTGLIFTKLRSGF